MFRSENERSHLPRPGVGGERNQSRIDVLLLEPGLFDPDLQTMGMATAGEAEGWHCGRGRVILTTSRPQERLFYRVIIIRGPQERLFYRVCDLDLNPKTSDLGDRGDCGCWRDLGVDVGSVDSVVLRGEAGVISASFDLCGSAMAGGR